VADDSLTSLIEGSDLAALIRHIDGACARRAWDELVDLRDRCEEAVTRGKQVWAVAQFAEYRLALEGPAPYAASVMGDGKGRFALGPLWEVAASTHTWADLSPQLELPTIRALVAHERSIRGDTVGEGEIDPHILGIPVVIQPWEPSYPVADYQSDRAVFPDEIFDIEMPWTDLPDPVERQNDDAVCDVLLDLVKPWWEDSLGKAEVSTVNGTVEQAIRTLGPHRVRLADVTAATAMEAMAWAGASGGGHGRRRGTPSGRTGAWWVMLEVLGYDDVPGDPTILGDEADELRWVLWDPGDRVGGWNLHVGISDPDDGIAWVLSAVDAV
jgi:resuscitation-promoting factor RpfA